MNDSIDGKWNNTFRNVLRTYIVQELRRQYIERELDVARDDLQRRSKTEFIVIKALCIEELKGACLTIAEDNTFVEVQTLTFTLRI